MSLNLQHIMMGLLIISAIILGSFQVLSGMSASYEVRPTDNTETYDKIRNLSNEIESNFNDTAELSPGKDSNVVIQVTQVLSKLGKLITTPMVMFKEIINAVSSTLQLPFWVVSFAISAISLLGFTALVAAILRYRP